MDFDFKIKAGEDVYFIYYNKLRVGRITSDFNFDLSVWDVNQYHRTIVSFNNYDDNTKKITNRDYTINPIYLIPSSIVKEENLDYIDVYILWYTMYWYIQRNYSIGDVLDLLADNLKILNFQKSIMQSKKKREFDENLKDKLCNAIVRIKPFAEHFSSEFDLQQYLKYYNSIMDI